jgi:FMN-dependent NADH-azoreductase
MKKLLNIEASPRGSRSGSSVLAKEFVSQFADEVVVDHLELWNEDLPELTGALLSAKYARLRGFPHSVEEASAWRRVEALIGRLASAEILVISTPIWNFSIPYKLKHYIDLVTQPGLSFLFDPASGYSPLLTPRPTYVIVSSAGDYRLGTSWDRPDLATPYLRAALTFIGLSDITFVPLAPTVGSETAVTEGHTRARVQIGELIHRVPS